jgi:hypothetical protein
MFKSIESFVQLMLQNKLNFQPFKLGFHIVAIFWGSLNSGNIEDIMPEERINWPKNIK